MFKSLHSEEYRRLAEWLIYNRKDKGLSMRDLAEKLGVSHSVIGKIEQRERRLDVVEYLIYCKELEISPIDGLKAIQSDIT